MKFSEILEPLRSGVTVRRIAWAEKWIVRQIPQRIQAEVIPKMTSLPDSAKALCETGIAYHDQVLLIEDARREVLEATSYTPTWADLFADDWVLVL